MPSSRRLKATAFFALIALVVILYITRGAKDTLESPFYTRTRDALNLRKQEEARDHVSHMDRIARVQTEHDQAIIDQDQLSDHNSEGTKQGRIPKAQSPIGGDLPHEPVAVHRPKPPGGDKPVAGRKTKGAKVVQKEGGDGDDSDGVAKVGNVEPKSTADAQSGSQTDEERRVEVELNSILKKGPIIIFSKSYCPFSMKAKRILLDDYSITPKPYVVELDQHELGRGLQAALHKTTGRRTVPNVLINGKSIGGGDDIEQLHHNDKLVSTIQTMGGKRIVKVEPSGGRVGLKFKA